MAEDPPRPAGRRPCRGPSGPTRPLYLARYQRRRAQAAAPQGGPDAAEEADSATPLYLRRFRERRADPQAPDAPPPVWNGEPLEVTRAWAEDTRNKEIVPERRGRSRPGSAADVFLIRHGETQGYSTESGLTPLGAWQAHRRGHTLANGSSATASRS